MLLYHAACAEFQSWDQDKSDEWTSEHERKLDEIRDRHRVHGALISGISFKVLVPDMTTREQDRAFLNGFVLGYALGQNEGSKERSSERHRIPVRRYDRCHARRGRQVDARISGRVGIAARAP